ncbi:hypothetical protein COHA_009578 [Chlorella ohadii]|uniref:Uncharacterized protein n=1 Tax=Chlorella ohadii TaxID=2649997 RepID=A0AAD5DGU1_9CHLO|nr:hypothetical protein COHA_009578 [Chlorella ohadii]
MLPRPTHPLACAACALTLALLLQAACARPLQSADTAAADAAPSLLDASEHVAAASDSHDSSLQSASRRLLMERPSGSRADAGLAVDPTPEATLVAEAFRPQAEQLLAELAAAGLRLTANAAQQQAALAAIQAAVKAVAAEAVSDTRRQMAALAAELRPADPSPAAMEALLLTPVFQRELRDARVEALLAIQTAMQPHESALAGAVHSALAPLVQAPQALQPLAAFQEPFLAEALPALASSIVEETLLRMLWRD